MNAQSFYGKKKADILTRLPPEDKSDDSCLSDSHDSDTEYEPPQSVQAPLDEDISCDTDEGDEKGVALGPNKTKKRNVKWKKITTLPPGKSPEWMGTIPDTEEVRSPIAYFKKFFDDDLLQHIVDQSSFYTVQKNPNKPLRLTKAELE